MTIRERNGSVWCHVERNRTALSIHVNDRLLFHMTNTHLVKSIRVKKAHISDNKLRIQQAIDHLRVDHTWRIDLISTLDAKFLEVLFKDRLDDALKKPISVCPNITTRRTDRANNKANL